MPHEPTLRNAMAEPDRSVVDTPAAKAERLERARKYYLGLPEWDRNRVLYAAGIAAMDNALRPLKEVNDDPMEGTRFRPPGYRPPSKKSRKDASSEALHNIEEVGVRQVEAQMRLADIVALEWDPDFLELRRVWLAYTRQVQAVAWGKGNQESAFISKFRDLCAARWDAEEEGDTADIRLADAKLTRLTGVEYPRFPEAAFDTLDTLAEPERTAELARLEAKYSPKEQAGNGRGRRNRPLAVVGSNQGAA